jgi:hypothetical protein
LSDSSFNAIPSSNASATVGLVDNHYTIVAVSQAITDVPCAVSASVVDNDDFKRIVDGLLQHASYAAFDGVG